LKIQVIKTTCYIKLLAKAHGQCRMATPALAKCLITSAPFASKKPQRAQTKILEYVS
jgi:hypothetical protein